MVLTKDKRSISDVSVPVAALELAVLVLVPERPAVGAPLDGWDMRPAVGVPESVEEPELEIVLRLLALDVLSMVDKPDVLELVLESLALGILSMVNNPDVLEIVDTFPVVDAAADVARPEDVLLLPDASEVLEFSKEAAAKLLLNCSV